MLFALQSPQEGLHTRMPHMVPAEETMMPFEARVVILGNLATGETKLRCPKFPCLLQTLGPSILIPLPLLSHRMVRGDPRAIVEYRDLDAPDDVDFF